MVAALRSGIEEMKDEHWPRVRAIYQDGIAESNATFETVPPAWNEWDRTHLREGRLVAKAEGVVVGWAALSSVSSRPAYVGVAEVSIYVAASAREKGIGRALLQALVEASERAGFWTLQGGIFPENKASIALHRSCGFREVGVRERIGRLYGVWRDVLLMERRTRIPVDPRRCEG